MRALCESHALHDVGVAVGTVGRASRRGRES